VRRTAFKAATSSGGYVPGRGLLSQTSTQGTSNGTNLKKKIARTQEMVEEKKQKVGFMN